jgi:GntR family transcriptional regulator, uxu operon transcriptional repressor
MVDNGLHWFILGAHRFTDSGSPRKDTVRTSPDGTRRRVETLLTEDGIRSGEQVPTERDLAKRLDLSRAGVRRVLNELESEGLIIRHVGRGTFLVDAPVTDNGQTSPADIMVVRRLLEPAVARLIVGAANSEDVAEIRRCVERSEAARTFEDFEHWDGALHRAMIAATHSPLLARIYAVIDHAREDPLWGTLKLKSFSPETRASYEIDHRKILDAIVNRDSNAAEQAVLDHVQNVTTCLLR